MSEVTQKRRGRQAAAQVAARYAPGWMGVIDAAATLGVHKDRVRRLINAGAVPVERYAETVLLSPDAVDQLRALIDAAPIRPTRHAARPETIPAGWVGLTEAGRLIGVHRDRVRRAAKAGLIPSQTIAGVLFVEASHLRQLEPLRPVASGLTEPAPAVDVPADVAQAVAADPAPVDLEEVYQ